MATKKTKKKLSPAPNKSTLILFGLVFGLTALLGATVYRVLKLENYVSNLSESFSAKYLNESEHSRYSLPVISVDENRVYIPEARIYLPLNETTRHLRYDYFTHDTVDTRLALSVANVVGKQDTDDDHACDKMILFTTTKQTSTTYKFVGELTPTKDSLQYLAAHTQESCGIYLNGIQDRLIESVKLIQNY